MGPVGSEVEKKVEEALQWLEILLLLPTGCPSGTRLLNVLPSWCLQNHLLVSGRLLVARQAEGMCRRRPPSDVHGVMWQNATADIHAGTIHAKYRIYTGFGATFAPTFCSKKKLVGFSRTISNHILMINGRVAQWSRSLRAEGTRLRPDLARYVMKTCQTRPELGAAEILQQEK